jgi:ADP-ribose pyrophosphatase
MPGGGAAQREVVEHMRAVAVVALDDDGHVVLIEQYRHPLHRRLWEIPAGLMDVDGEPPLATAQRELLEEAGLTAENWFVLVDLASSPGFCTEAVRVFLATGIAVASAPQAVDEEADLRQIRLPLADAAEAVLRGDIATATAVAGLLAASRVLANGYDAAHVLRPGDDPWTDSPALVAGPGPIGDAPLLADSGRGR